MQIMADSNTMMTLVVTDAEKAIAKEVKVDFKEILKKLDKSVESVSDLRKAVVEQHPSQDDLAGKYRGKLLRYRRKIQAVFNEFLVSTQKALEKMVQISDPENIRLREVLSAEIGELKDGGEAVLDLLQDPEKDGFSQSLEQISAQIERRSKSIKEVITNQLYSHVDNDILGKMRVGELHFRIMRRARILKQLVRGK